ncbi:PREDICTED: LEAF RUST 10 DISEASE-RESISTANCE LOCUS RECEPTOR-LIKE PROTEIN KINASE-like 1.1 isoform X3 [Ipomoea nil]|uniref:LEAF RUST 10 DISEASE-RESISTANCE LOCUS RECEPTOR-LIKE PROTEIN KINASE-like 1.1 isoform X3 n=1 Tax=Ipomoea nil TaxID=35883 RepID=UPI000901E802|nr:PREDICTED: LEAF RUST 10 DISEASE-RESISTANCE LOCUS RECEPTOR-LIKE PROTEIN KINASE-like 1.1 isoform X3 [Ipomoea nil]
MGLLFNPSSFFLLFTLMLFLYFAHGEDEFLASNCTNRFFCGSSMGYLEFPFAQHTQPHCGLVVVNCSATPPTLQLETGGDWYPLQHVKPSPVWGDYVIFLGDLKLQRLLEDPPNYSNLNYTLQFPYSPSITLHNLEAKELNPQFLKCTDSEADDDMGNYERYNCTQGFSFSLNYKHPLSPQNPKCEAANCTLYPTPILVKQTNTVLTTAQFGLEFQVSQTCNECYQGGGQCIEDSKNKFHCAKDELPSNCTKGFLCGSMGYLEFPFAQQTQPHCGLIAVDCDAKPLPTLQLGTGGDWYQFVSNDLAPNTIFLEDLKLQGLLESCKYSNLNYTLQFPNSQSITFRNLEAKPFLECNHSQAYDIGNYEICNSTEGFSFSLKYTSENNPKCDTAANCTLYPSPILVEQTNALITAQFGIYLEVSPACYDCYHGGGICRADSNNEFQCTTDSKNESQSKKGKSKLRLVLITVLSGGLALILVSLAIFVVWRRKKGSKGYSRNTSLDPTSDLERGQSRFFGILVFSYSELEEATNNFDPSKELGDGGFGTVYYGRLGDGREVAVKRLHERTCKRMEQFANEISILTRLKHQNLVTLYGCSTMHNRELLLVYEYIPNGTLADHLHGKRAADQLLTWPIRMTIAVETAAALVYLHASDIIHRDVKSSNILLDNNFCVKVADFGLSRLFPANVTHYTTTPQGTPGYVDPDYHECYQLTYKSDVYSFGVVLIELISSMPALDMRRHTDEIHLAKLAMSKFLTGAFDELIDSSLGHEQDTEINRMATSVAALAFQCLQPDKDMRPTMEHVFKSLKEIQGNELSNDDERVNGVETNVSIEEEVRRKAMRWTWAGPSLADGVILKHFAATKSSC